MAVTGARLLRARVAPPKSRNVMMDGRDTLWYGGEQACNVSLAKDGSKRVAFLDFGGETGHKFVGKKYGVHERILIADSTGKLVHSVKAPSGYTFDHVEWAIHSSSGDLLVATLADSHGNHKQIVAVNLEDDSVTELIGGEDLWHPCLWSKDVPKDYEDEALDLDSAGVYLMPGYEPQDLVFRVKMEVFWKRLPYTRVIFVGSSRMEFGVDPDMYPELEMTNVGAMGIDIERDVSFITNYVFNHLGKVQGDEEGHAEQAPGHLHDDGPRFLAISDGMGCALDARIDSCNEKVFCSNLLAFVFYFAGAFACAGIVGGESKTGWLPRNGVYVRGTCPGLFGFRC